jgi:hypothetical protein
MEALVTILPPSLIAFDFEPGVKAQSEVFFKNNSDEALKFKVKLTHFDMYTVSPTHGLLKPGESTTVKITLKPTQSVGLKSHKFEFVFTAREASNVQPFSHRLKADFGMTVAKRSPRKSAAKESGQVTTLVEDPVFWIGEHHEDTLGKLREELARAERRLQESKAEQVFASDEKPAFTRNLMLVYFLVGLFLGLYVLNR